jgi:hypothetical protein
MIVQVTDSALTNGRNSVLIESRRIAVPVKAASDGGETDRPGCRSGGRELAGPTAAQPFEIRTRPSTRRTGEACCSGGPYVLHGVFAPGHSCYDSHRGPDRSFQKRALEELDSKEWEQDEDGDPGVEITVRRRRAAISIIRGQPSAAAVRRLSLGDARGRGTNMEGLVTCSSPAFVQLASYE